MGVTPLKFLYFESIGPSGQFSFNVRGWTNGKEDEDVERVY